MTRFFFHNSYLALQNEGGRLAVALLVGAGIVALLGLMRLPAGSRNFWYEGALIALAVCAVNLGEVLLELPAALALGVAVFHARLARQGGADPHRSPCPSGREPRGPVTAIAIAANRGDVGGGEVMLVNLATALRDLGHEVSVVAPARARRGGPARRVPRAAGDHDRGQRTGGVRSRAPTLAPDPGRRPVLWCNGLLPAAATTLRSGRVVHLHQPPDGLAQRLLARIARWRAVAVVVPSAHMRARLGRGTTVLPELDPGRPRSTRAHRRPGRPHVAGSHRLSRPRGRAKGVDVLGQACGLLEPALRDRVELVVVGDDRFMPASDREAVDQALAGSGVNVSRLGWQSRETFFETTDLAVFPSVWAEPFGLVVAEAMEARCPVVVSDAGALPEVVGADYPWSARSGDAAVAGRRDHPRRRVPARDRAHAEHARALGGALLTGGRAAPPGRPAGLLGHVVNRPRVAIAHDYLTQRGGAERVVLALVRAFPDATVHTLLYDAGGTYPEFRDVRVVTSPLDRVGALRRHHRAALPLLAPAASRLRVDADVTIVSTSGWAHGFDIGGRSLVYCHNPARWLYQTDEYLGDRRRSVPGLAVRGARTRAAALGPEGHGAPRPYLANASVVRDRMRATYGIDAAVVFPPAAVTTEGDQRQVGPFDDGLPPRRVPAAAVQERRQSRRGLPRPARRAAAGDRSRPGGGAAPAQPPRQRRDRLRRHRRPAAVGLRARDGAGGPEHRGPRPHAAGGRGVRAPDPGAAPGRVPRHRRRGRQRPVLRPCRAGRRSPRQSAGRGTPPGTTTPSPGTHERSTRRRSASASAGRSPSCSGTSRWPPSARAGPDRRA